jgi:hypothetical protein
MVCMGVNTMSGSNRFTCLATHGSPAPVGDGPITHGRSGSISSWRSSEISMVTSGVSAASSSTSRAPNRLMPSCRPSRV